MTTTKTFGNGGNLLIIEEQKRSQKLTETSVHSYEWTKSIGISIRAEGDLVLSTQSFYTVESTAWPAQWHLSLSWKYKDYQRNDRAFRVWVLFCLLFYLPASCRDFLLLFLMKTPHLVEFSEKCSHFIYFYFYLFI